MKRVAGFTLVELLVVSVVLALLLASVAPALARAKQKTKAIACLNHLRQWGLATQLYAADHDDYLPPDGAPNPTASSTNFGWYIQLPAQLGQPRYHDMAWRTNAQVNPGSSLFICPANPRRSNGRNLFHYCLNEHVNGTGADARVVRLSSLQQPTRLVWLFDSKNLPAVGSWSFVHTNLHARGAHLLFLDGHVTRFPSTAYWDPVADKPRTDHPSILWTP